MYTIKEAIPQLYLGDETQGDFIDPMVDVYLYLSQDNVLSKQFVKATKKMIRLSKKYQKLQEKNGSGDSDKRLENQTEIQSAIRVSCQKQVSDTKDYLDSIQIADYFLKRYKIGLGISDRVVRRMHTPADTAYGTVLHHLLKSQSSQLIRDTLKQMLNRGEPSFYARMVEANPDLTNREFHESKEGALLLENHLIIFLIEQLTEEYTEDQKEQFLQDILEEAEHTDKELAEKIRSGYNQWQRGASFTNVMLNLVRYIMGKGRFMNSAVKLTNILLRAFMGKGMSYGRNAIFRKYLARFLERGPLLYINVLLLLFDLISIANPRRDFEVMNAVVLFYTMRNPEVFKVSDGASEF